ncbi:hypothetical protein PG991_015265 [Apiospora marii]|uniref:F-box domain-containing protein n=1 Tax=Apiospora marii TaxID=335849 RepID=A0ABR1R142_9PEZI
MEELINCFSRLQLEPFQLKDDHNAGHGLATGPSTSHTSAVTNPRKKWRLDTIPIEIIRDIAEYLTMRDLNNLKMTCKGIHASIVGPFYYERQVAWEYMFDLMREWIVVRQDVMTDFITFTPEEVAAWPESRAEKYAYDFEGAKELFCFLDRCVDVWGPGILYFTYSVFDTFWDKGLVKQLPRYHREGSLINRAISSCRDPVIMEQVMNAYSMYYKDSLDGLKQPPVRRRFVGHVQNNDAPPVFWACSENRVDVLELLNRKDGHDDLRHWVRMDIGRVSDEWNSWPYEEGIFEEWHQSPTTLIDAWESAFHPRDAMGRRKPANRSINEDACVWLINHKLGYNSRPAGIPLQHLAEAAVLKKERVVDALLRHFRATLAPKKYQRAVSLALLSAARGWVGPSPPRPRPRPQANSSSADICPDGHRTVIDMLYEACTWWGTLKQESRDGKGILAQAVKYAPRNANYLLEKQMELRLTDWRDVRGALMEALEHGGSEDTHRLEFFKTVFLHNEELACDADKLYEDGDAGYRREVDGLRREIVDHIQNNCRRTGCFDVAMCFAEWVGREWFDDWFIQTVEAAEVSDDESVAPSQFDAT